MRIKVKATNEVGTLIKQSESAVLVEFYAGSCCNRTEMLPIDAVEFVDQPPTQAECCDGCKVAA
jgi:hypothetical protein